MFEETQLLSPRQRSDMDLHDKFDSENLGDYEGYRCFRARVDFRNSGDHADWSIQCFINGKVRQESPRKDESYLDVAPLTCNRYL